MLYDRWRQIVQENREELALIDCASGQRWTFQQLFDEGERGAPSPRPAFPMGMSHEFILSVLRGWKHKAVLCPLEEGQEPVYFPPPPPSCVHLKATSATTGPPRLIAFTAEQLMADADQIVAAMGLRPEWPNVGVISLAHSYGFSNLVLPLLLCGIPLILGGSPLPESVRRAAALAPDVTLAAVPALWRAWLNAGATPSNARLAISAGSPLPLPLEQEVFAQCGLKIHNFYGASECGGIAYDASETPRLDGCCVGAPIPGVELSVSAESCLRVRSRAAGMTYWPSPAPALQNGQYHTSDLAELENGLVFLRGRHTELINVAGRKVSPETIERALAAHPNVCGCLVFGAPGENSDRTELIVACVAARSKTTGHTLKQYLLGSLPAWQIPRDWWFVPTLQANTRGKLARGEWRQKYLERRKD